MIPKNRYKAPLEVGEIYTTRKEFQLVNSWLVIIAKCKHPDMFDVWMPMYGFTRVFSDTIRGDYDHVE